MLIFWLLSYSYEISVTVQLVPKQNDVKYSENGMGMNNFGPNCIYDVINETVSGPATNMFQGKVSEGKGAISYNIFQESAY